MRVAHLSAHQKVENAQTEHFEGDAHMSVIIEPIQHLHAQAGTINTGDYLLRHEIFI